MLLYPCTTQVQAEMANKAQHFWQLCIKLIRYYTDQNVTDGWLLIGDELRKLEVWNPKYCVEHN